MSIPGHRHSPPKFGQTKSRSNSFKELLRQFFPYHHILSAQKDNNKQSPENTQFFQGHSVPNKSTFSCETGYAATHTEKVSEQVF